MIVTCEKCQTSYYLDEERIKGTSARVRCSRCQHEFVVAKADTAEELDLSGYLETEDSAPVKVSSPSDTSSEAEIKVKPSAREIESPFNLKPASPPRKRRPWLAMALGSLALLIVLIGGWWYINIFSDRTPAADRVSTVAQPTTSSGSRLNLPAAGPAPAAHSEAGLQDLNIIEHRAFYTGLKDSQGRRLLVLSGRVQNEGTGPRGPIRLRAILTDKNNKPVKERLFYCGTTFSAEELQNLDADQINTWLDTPGGREGSPAVLSPGQTSPFTVVFFDVPQEVTGYSLAVVNAPVVSSAPDKP